MFPTEFTLRIVIDAPAIERIFAMLLMSASPNAAAVNAPNMQAAPAATEGQAVAGLRGSQDVPAELRGSIDTAEPAKRTRGRREAPKTMIADGGPAAPQSIPADLMPAATPAATPALDAAIASVPSATETMGAVAGATASLRPAEAPKPENQPPLTMPVPPATARAEIDRKALNGAIIRRVQTPGVGVAGWRKFRDEVLGAASATFHPMTSSDELCAKLADALRAADPAAFA